jgi:hypothetical protein
MPNQLAALPRLSQADQRRFLRYCRWLQLCETLSLPPFSFSKMGGCRRQVGKPVAFALRATACMFALLFIMPAHPLVIPTVIGGGLAFALFSQTCNPVKGKLC